MWCNISVGLKLVVYASIAEIKCSIYLGSGAICWTMAVVLLPKGSSIYDVHNNQVLVLPSPCPHASTWAGAPSALVDVHNRSTRNTHRSLEMASTMTYRT